MQKLEQWNKQQHCCFQTGDYVEILMPLNFVLWRCSLYFQPFVWPHKLECIQNACQEQIHWKKCYTLTQVQDVLNQQEINISKDLFNVQLSCGVFSPYALRYTFLITYTY